jgi:Chaperone of endosialidase
MLMALTFLCLAVGPKAQAVSPPPDGGYPGGNTAEGQNALLSLTTGGFNTAIGFLSLRSDTAGAFNTAIGAGTLLANTADQNTAAGAGALLSNTTGASNTATGAFALFSNTFGIQNTATGHQSLSSNTGSQNTAIGAGAMQNNTTGSDNTAIGLEALLNSTTGNNNTAVGTSALESSTGNFNVALGVDAGSSVTAASNVICIGSPGADVSDSCFIENIRGVTTAHANAIPVLIDSAGQLGTMNSSRRFKKEIKPMEKASESILALTPVTFHYKNQDTKKAENTPQFGLIAEDVAEVNPDLVVRDADGKPFTVRYEAVNAMLLNEFLKEHHKVQEQGATITQQRNYFETAIAQQQKEIEALTATVKQQAVQIQKVSAQLEASKPAPQMVNNP